MQHLFWHDFDESHPRFAKGSAHANALRDYYKFLDHHIGELLKLLDPDTHVVVVSDHGAQPSHGAIAVNQWLLDNGWLVLHGAAPTEPTPLSKLKIDWSRTKAWAEGGYYARIHLNLKGREPEGIISREAAEDEKAALAEALRTAGGDLGHEVYRPEDVYAATRGVPPDLIVHFGALRWRAEARVGFKEVLLRDVEGAGDDVGHHEDGIFVMAGPGTAHRAAALEGLEIYDVAPTLLRLMGQPVPADMRGRVIG
jgi:predicted AlkP superfamily phosphohydrolase/phosphomutase